MEHNASVTSTIVRRRRQRRNVHRQARARGLFSTFVILSLVLVVGIVAVFVGGTAIAVGIYFLYARELPPPSQIAQVRQQFETTLIYDRTGKTTIYQVLDPAGDRRSVPLSEIPRDLLNATIAIEDKSFYANPGFDLRGMLRAVWLAFQEGSIQGASTITQQLVKNTLIAPEERTAITQDRKIKEIILATEISRLYPKDQILEWYLNTNFYGNLAYGVGTAAQVYFGKRVQDLSLGESAMLAAIPQNPQLNPIEDWMAARQRQMVVLESMAAAGYITPDQATEAASQTIVIKPQTERYGIVAPHFAVFARQQAEQILTAQGLDGPRLVLGNGLRIYTTLDLDLHYQAECAMRAYVERIAGGNPTAAPNTSEGQPCFSAQYLPTVPGFQLGKRRNVTNAATVVIRPATGEILAMVGSLDYFNTGIQGNFNAALGLRQPASAFKPFVYVTAFASANHDYTPAKMVVDVPTTFNSGGTPYTPRNEDGNFHGPMSIRDALANSYNIPVVKVLSDVTPGQVLRRARQLGINSLTKPLDQYGLALALGSGEVTLTELTYAYTPFANLGFMVGKSAFNPRPGFRTLDPVAVLRIEDREGRVLWKYEDTERTFGKQNVVSDALAYLITDILSDNDARIPAFGKGNALELSRPAAAKTGTTNDNRDAWTVGYTPQFVTGVWVGNNDNTAMGEDVSGSTGAAPIWHAIMEYIHNRDAVPVTNWPRPSTVIEATVCEDSGLLPTPICPRVKELFYVDPQNGVNTIPTQADIYWKRYRINARNGLLATALTPQNLVTERVYFDYPPEALAWALGQGIALAPTEYDSVGASAQAARAGEITSPAGLGRLRGAVDIRGRLSDNVSLYVLEYGAGINPENWIAIVGGEPKETGTETLLGKWDTSALNGLYTLRLGMVLKDQSFQPYTVQVTIDNSPPAARITAPTPNGEVNAGIGALKIDAEVSDDFELDRVEFYWNDQLIATLRPEGNQGAQSGQLIPFSTEWRIVQLGQQSFWVVAYDSVGNATKSEVVQVNIVN